MRNYNLDRPTRPRYSGIRYGYTGGHAEDRSVHRLSAGLERGYSGIRRYGRQRQAAEAAANGRSDHNKLRLAPITTGSLRRAQLRWRHQTVAYADLNFGIPPARRARRLQPSRPIQTDAQLPTPNSQRQRASKNLLGVGSWSLSVESAPPPGKILSMSLKAVLAPVLVALLIGVHTFAQGIPGTRAHVLGQAGWEAIREGRNQDAADAFSKAVIAEPRDPSLHLGAGLAAYLLGQVSSAQESLAARARRCRRRLPRRRCCSATSIIETTSWTRPCACSRRR